MKTLSQLRGYEVMASEELERMPFDLDITESLFYKQACDMVYDKALKQTTEAAKHGEKEGETRMLTLMLVHRFGAIPEHSRLLIAHASSSQLERWAIRATDARTLAEVFAG